MEKRIEIIQRFDNILQEINKLRDELKVGVKRDELTIRVSMIELERIGEIMKDKEIRKYSILKKEWLNIF